MYQRKELKPRVKKTVDNIINKVVNKEIHLYEGLDKVADLGDSYFYYYVDRTVDMNLAFKKDCQLYVNEN